MLCNPRFDATLRAATLRRKPRTQAHARIKAVADGRARELVLEECARTCPTLGEQHCPATPRRAHWTRRGNGGGAVRDALEWYIQQARHGGQSASLPQGAPPPARTPRPGSVAPSVQVVTRFSDSGRGCIAGLRRLKARQGVPHSRSPRAANSSLATYMCWLQNRGPCKIAVRTYKIM